MSNIFLNILDNIASAINKPQKYGGGGDFGGW
jgi:hypothetical protein